MLSVELHTREGEYITTVEAPMLVKVGEQRMPEVILWGVRFFALDSIKGVYREAFAYAVPLEKF
jgi:hypothetical protein